MPGQRRVLVVGGIFAELCVVCVMTYNLLVTFVDAQEYFEYTPGVLWADVKPKHLDALTFICSLGKVDDVPVMRVVQVSRVQVVVMTVVIPQLHLVEKSL